MVDRKRWRRAQQYESAYWEGVAEKEADLSWYEWRAGRLAGELDRVGLGALTDGSSRVLEVGSGPVGLISFFPARRRVAVEPLSPTFDERPALVELRDDTAHFVAAVGERLPVRNDAFDLVVIENCIDHVRDVDRVMAELGRVLGPAGVLYLTVNCRSPWGYHVHRVLANLRLDPGHPHSFTVDRLRRLAKRHEFRILDLTMSSLVEAFWDDLTSGRPKDIAKAGLGVSFATASMIARLSRDVA